jgi:hypothetical protein
MMLIVVKVSVAFYLVMLNVIKLFVVMLSVVAPCRPRMLQKYGSENEERRFWKKIVEKSRWEEWWKRSFLRKKKEKSSKMKEVKSQIEKRIEGILGTERKRDDT